MTGGVFISGAVEGVIDEAVARHLIAHIGGVPATIYGRKGRRAIERGINGYNNAARHSLWLVLMDLDADECAPPVVNGLLADRRPGLCFRLAVREVEAWLLADRERMADFLSVAASRLPESPEDLAQPKDEIVRLARQSRRRDIREDLVPRVGSGRVTGPGYESRLIVFSRDDWRPDVAAASADSLRRAIACLRHLVEEAA